MVRVCRDLYVSMVAYTPRHHFQSWLPWWPLGNSSRTVHCAFVELQRNMANTVAKQTLLHLTMQQRGNCNFTRRWVTFEESTCSVQGLVGLFSYWLGDWYLIKMHLQHEETHVIVHNVFRHTCWWHTGWDWRPDWKIYICSGRTSGRCSCPVSWFVICSTQIVLWIDLCHLFHTSCPVSSFVSFVSHKLSSVDFCPVSHKLSYALLVSFVQHRLSHELIHLVCFTIDCALTWFTWRNSKIQLTFCHRLTAW